MRPYDGLRVYSAFLIALLFRQPDHPRIAAVAAEVERPHLRRVGAHGAAATIASMRRRSCSTITTGRPRATTAAALIEHVAPWLARPAPDAAQSRLVVARTSRSITRSCGEYGKARQVMAETEAIALEHRLNFILFEVYHADVVAAASTQDARAAARCARETAHGAESRAPDGTRILPDAGGGGAYARPARQRSRAPRPPMRCRSRAKRACRRSRSRTSSCAKRCRHLRLGEVDDRARALRGGDRPGRRHRPAQLRLPGGPGPRSPRCGATATKSPRCARARRCCPTCRAARLSRIHAPGAGGLRAAVRAGAGTRHRAALRARASSASAAARHRPSTRPAWPWPLKIRTLGAFALLRDDKPLASTGKAQKKPLELLKAVVAHGGRAVDAALLTSLLWPDAEGDDAKTSFDSNLYRLRKLLAVDNALPLDGGQAVAQPAASCGWTPGRSRPRSTPTRRRSPTALALYGGGFLAPRRRPGVGAAIARPAAGTACARGAHAGLRARRRRAIGPARARSTKRCWSRTISPKACTGGSWSASARWAMRQAR